jgi:pSer/pThr/pTyr-binding forkhead associated (FHA) protein
MLATPSIPDATTGFGYLRDVRRDRLYRLSDRTAIGRDLGNAIVVDEPDVSRSHAEVVRRGEAYVIVPQVTTVTSVNGALVLAPTPLHEGDEVGIGSTTLRFLVTVPTGARLATPVRPTAWRAIRASRAPTLFLGRVEARERRLRETRRKLSRLAAVIVAVLAIGSAVASLYMTARAPARLAPRLSTTE